MENNFRPEDMFNYPPAINNSWAEKPFSFQQINQLQEEYKYKFACAIACIESHYSALSNQYLRENVVAYQFFPLTEIVKLLSDDLPIDNVEWLIFYDLDTYDKFLKRDFTQDWTDFCDRYFRGEEDQRKLGFYFARPKAINNESTNNLMLKAKANREELKRGNYQCYLLNEVQMTKSIRCLCCGIISYNINDICQKYCSFCDTFHADFG